jgi:hypothetical protein
MNAAQTNYDNAVTAEATAKAAYDAEVSDCVITATPNAMVTYMKLQLMTLNS